VASYYKRDRSPYFWISYRDVDGTQRIINSKLRHDQEAEAEALCRSLERKVQLAKPEASALTVREWAEQWFKDRESKVKSMKDDRSRIRKHILPRVGSIELRRLRKADLQAVFDELRKAHEATGKPASGTIKSILAAVKVMFNDAVAGDLIPSSPLFLTSKTLPTVHKKPRLPYTLTEIESIISARPEAIPDDRRTLYALLFFFGLRFGEGAALRWGDLDKDADPFASMNVTRAWSNARNRMDTTKTETTRKAPVHPAAFFLLQQWRDVGFPKMFGRAPEPDDLIVPSREGRPRSSNHGMKRLRQDLERIGLKHLEMRTQHAFRTTFISQMRAADVEKDKVRAVTHGKRSSGDVIDAFYTQWPWEVLCKAVATLPFSESFLHSFYTAVSIGKDWEKWRGGRDSNSGDQRYWQLLNAKLNAFSAGQREVIGASVEGFSTLPEAPPTSPLTLSTQPLEDLEEGCIITVEPLPLEEILRGLPWADQVLKPAPVRADPPMPLRGLVTVACEACGKACEVEDGPGIWECVLCGSKRVRVGV
jgi:integrase